MQCAPIAGYKNDLYPKGSVTQWFAMNPERYGKICYKDLTYPGGQYCMAGHNGIDIVAPWGTPLLAVVDGVIGDVKYSEDGYGKHVRLFGYESGGTVDEWVYGHCSSIKVKVGQRVKAGDVIAYMGNTGFVVSGATPFWKHNPYAGTHLHLGKRVHRVWNGNGSYNLQVGGMKLANIIDYHNGYFGSVDFSAELAAVSSDIDTPQEASMRLTLASMYNQFQRAIENSRRV